ncbi:MAG: phosphatase PAP2 family protein [Candidatus Gracilibacteria bacterium]|nr:phosphatase PAP2 family protein [Candidatus Gracilibacteria bacterium]
MSINKELSSYLNSFYQNDFLNPVVSLFSDLPIFFLPIFLVVMWIYYNYKKNKEGKINLLFIFYSVALVIIISYIIKNIYHVDRPMMSLQNAGNLVLSKIPDASFPSDHAGVSFSFLTAIFLLGYKKLSYLLFPIFILMNLSRIIGGVHWPFDILAGILNGVISAFIIYKLRFLNIFKKINDFLLKIASFFKL